jgi:hypothetical protein
VYGVVKEEGEREPDVASQVSFGRQGNAEMLNRSAVVVRPRQPFVDWLRSVEELEEPNITLEQLDKTPATSGHGRLGV